MWTDTMKRETGVLFEKMLILISYKGDAPKMA